MSDEGDKHYRASVGGNNALHGQGTLAAEIANNNSLGRIALKDDLGTYGGCGGLQTIPQARHFGLKLFHGRRHVFQLFFGPGRARRLRLRTLPCARQIALRDDRPIIHALQLARLNGQETDRQVDDLQRLAAHRGIEIVHIAEEKMSGGRTDRPARQKLIDTNGPKN